MTYVHMADAAFAQNIPPGFPVVAGYYGGPQAYHVWSPEDWQRFPENRKLPIWVAGYNGLEEGKAAVATLQQLGVPKRVYTGLDMETRIDKTYVTTFGAELHAEGYLVWVYGSAGTVEQNPQLNGYWIADYTLNPLPVIAQVGVRAVQWAADLAPGYDASLVKQWTTAYMWQ